MCWVETAGTAVNYNRARYLSIIKVSTTVSMLFYTIPTVPGLTLKPSFNSQNSRPSTTLSCHLPFSKLGLNQSAWRLTGCGRYLQLGWYPCLASPKPFFGRFWLYKTFLCSIREFLKIESQSFWLGSLYEGS